MQLLGQGSNQQLNVQADLNKLSPAAQKAESLRVEEAIAKLVGTSVENVQNGVQTVGPTWGSSITNKAIEALIVFFIVVGIYISIRFEPKMALAAFIAMVHDVLVAVGVYSLVQLPGDAGHRGGHPDHSRVLALRHRGGVRPRPGQHEEHRVERAHDLRPADQPVHEPDVGPLHQHLGRGHHPGVGRALVGAELLGASTLQEYGLALFVGLLSGAYSSIFIASPILACSKAASRAGSPSRTGWPRGATGRGSFSATDAAALDTAQHRRGRAAPPRRPGQGGAARPSGPAHPPGLRRRERRGPAPGTGTARHGPPPSTVSTGTAAAATGSARRPARPRKGKGKRKR